MRAIKALVGSIQGMGLGTVYGFRLSGFKGSGNRIASVMSLRSGIALGFRNWDSWYTSQISELCGRACADQVADFTSLYELLLQQLLDCLPAHTKAVSTRTPKPPEVRTRNLT